MTHGDKPSVVQLRSDILSQQSIGKQVVDALRQLESELESGALVDCFVGMNGATWRSFQGSNLGNNFREQ